MCEEEYKVSIIVPVYKVEKYLLRCLDSIAVQTYQNIEVILVDDGSPDNCGKICDEYAIKHSTFRVIHQRNQGLSAARNNAIPHSSGEYITFIDSDDYITPDYVEYLVRLQRKYNSDVSVGGRVYQYEDCELAKLRTSCRDMFFPTEKALSYMNYGVNFSVFAWGKLYKRELLEKYHYPVGKLYEDLATTYRIVGDTTGVAFGEKQIYFWVQRPGSIMNSKFSERHLAALDATKAQIEYMRKRYPSVLPSAKARHEAKIVELMAIAMRSANSRQAYRELKMHSSYFSEVMRDKLVRKSQKIRMLGIRMGYYPARVVLSLHEMAKRYHFG